MKRVTAGVIVTAAVALGAGDARAATWSGETNGTVYRSNRLASGGHSWDGTFQFATRGDGSVRGYAVVTYKPEIDVSGTDNALGFIRDVVPAAFGLLGPLEGAAATAGLTSIIGFDVAYQRGAVVRRGPLTGRVTRSGITLNWLGKVPGIPYDLNMVLPGSEQRVSGGRIGLRDPFTGTGRIAAPGFAVRSAQARSKDGDTDESSAGYWAAHRVG